MGLVKRIGSIFKAKANKVVEQAEKSDPIGIAKAELREAQEDLGKFESAIKQASAQQILIQKQIKQKEDAFEDWKDKGRIAKEAEKMELAEQACERAIGFKEEADALKESLKKTSARFESKRSQFEAKRKEIGQLKSTIKDAEIRFNASKAMNDLETSETSGAGVKSVDRINDMLDIVDEEEALADAGADLGTTDEQRLESEFETLGKGKKASSLLDSL